MPDLKLLKHRLIPVKAIDWEVVRKNLSILNWGSRAFFKALIRAAWPSFSKSTGSLLILASLREALMSERQTSARKVALFSLSKKASAFSDAPYRIRKDADGRSAKRRVEAVQSWKAATPFSLPAKAAFTCSAGTNASVWGDSQPFLR